MRKSKNQREILRNKDLVYYLAKRLNIPSDLAFKFIMEFSSMIEEGLVSDYEVEFGRLGCFRIADVKAIKNFRCRNPVTGEIIYKDVGPKRRVFFKLNKRVRENLNPKSSSDSIEEIE